MKFQQDSLTLLSRLFTNTPHKLVIYKEGQDFPIYQDFIITSNKIKDAPTNYQQQKFSYINNRDGSMRWIFPSDLPHPNFLKFYSASSLLSKVYTKVIQTLYSFKLGRLGSSGSFYIYHKSPLFPQQITQKLSGNNYAAFTGTVGPNRKILLAINQGQTTSHFIKIPLQNKSENLIKNEVKTLETLQEKNFKFLEIPQVEKSDFHSIGIFTNVADKTQNRPLEIQRIHINALSELYQNQTRQEKINNTSIWSTIEDNIKNKVKKPTLQRLQEKLKSLKAHIETQSSIPLAYAHGDFTPWNMYVSENQLHLYDWELAMKDAPLLFDVFHFIFQTGILIKHQSFKEIQNEIKLTLQQPAIQELSKKYNIDTVLHYHLYLLYNIGYYLQIYEQQKELHTQVSWLTKVWEQALVESLNMYSTNNHRQDFIKDIFQYLSDKKYALLKFSERKISDIALSSDLDILIQKADLKPIIHWTENHPSIEKVHTQNNSFMSFIEIFFKDGTFLEIDLIHQFKRKNLEILDATGILERTTQTLENIKIPHLADDLEYCLLFYFLNGAAVPKRYIHFYYKFHPEEQADVLYYLNKKYDLNLRDFYDLEKYDETIRKNVLAYTTQQSSNKGFNKIKNTLNYYKDTFKNLFTQKGLVITISGVDGAGKSTIINEIKQNISTKYRKKIVVLRHRPSLFPILSSYVYGKEKAEQRAADRLPRQGNNSNKLLSFIRFLYYYIDYLIGQFFVYFKYLCRGYIVIYDRYYFDFINDAKRSNIVLNRKVAQFLYRFIYKPQLNFFLYAPAHIILSRKQELDPKAINELTQKYFSLFEKFAHRYQSSKYINIQNIDKEETVDSIMEEFRNAM